MKKTILILAAALTIALDASARRPKVEGDFTVINQERLSVQVNLDYTEAMMDDMPFEKAILDMKYTREQWDQIVVPELAAKFCASANRECKSVLLSNATNSLYTITVRAITVDDDGETEAVVTLRENATNAVLGEVTLNADGGRYGSWTNLMGDAMERMGETLGKIIDD